MTTFRIERVEVPDPDVWPTDYSKMVTRYALVDDRGSWCVHGHVFGSLESITADRSSCDVRHLLRKTPELANRDKFHPPIDANDPDSCNHYSFEWDRVPEFIHVFGADAVIDNYFECSGSSVVRDFSWPSWIDKAVALFGPRLKDHARTWLTRQPRFMPTSYLGDHWLDRMHKAEWERNIVATAATILARLEVAL